jgi:hypothetical protein
MSQQGFAEALVEIAAIQPRPPINVSLTDRTRLNLSNWTLASDCLIDHWPSGKPRYLIPLLQIVAIEMLETRGS